MATNLAEGMIAKPKRLGMKNFRELYKTILIMIKIEMSQKTFVF